MQTLRIKTRGFNLAPKWELLNLELRTDSAEMPMKSRLRILENPIQEFKLVPTKNRLDERRRM